MKNLKNFQEFINEGYDEPEYPVRKDLQYLLDKTIFKITWKNSLNRTMMDFVLMSPEEFKKLKPSDMVECIGSFKTGYDIYKTTKEKMLTGFIKGTIYYIKKPFGKVVAEPNNYNPLSLEDLK